MSGVYQDRADPSLFVRFPLIDRQGESLVIWTTTPWTLPANVAAAVNPEAEYGLRSNGEWVAVARYPDEEFTARMRGADMVGWTYRGPFDELVDVTHRVIPWDEVSLDEGTGIVHIAPGCGGEDFELSQVHGLDVITPVDESGRFYPNFGWLKGLSTVESADQIIGHLTGKGLVVESGLYTHRYPHCWRCDTPLIFRIADDWFISVRDLRQQMLDANATVEWTPEYMGKRMDDWLRNMGDWNISRRRYYGLPLPFYPCACGHLNVIGSRAELEERALEGLDQLEELRRPWIDRVPIRCEECGERVERVVEVGDVWLDAGVVPFSTLGWQNPEWKHEGYATGAARGLTTADLPDHAYWEKWFPADWVSEMREQIRLWFYSQLFMSVVLIGRAPFKRVLGYEKMLDEEGREMHGSWGNMIEANDAFARMGADVMRWQYCAQPPDRNLLFGFGPAESIKREILTLWNSVKFFVEYANIDGFRPSWSALNLEGDIAPLDHWLVERTHAFVRDAEAGYESYLTRGRHARVPGVHRRSLQLVHPPLAPALLGGRRRGRVPDALVRDRADDARHGADPPVRHRPSVADARAGRAVVGPSRRLAGRSRSRPHAARRGRRRASRRHARAPGAECRGPQPPAAAAEARGRGRDCEWPFLRDRGRGERQGGRVRSGRG